VSGLLKVLLLILIGYLVLGQAVGLLGIVVSILGLVVGGLIKLGFAIGGLAVLIKVFKGGK
jgi:hypothetical protein